MVFIGSGFFPINYDHWFDFTLFSSREDANLLIQFFRIGEVLVICKLAKVECGPSHRGHVVAFGAFSWKRTKVEPTFVQKSQLDTIFLSSDVT